MVTTSLHVRSLLSLTKGDLSTAFTIWPATSVAVPGRTLPMDWVRPATLASLNVKSDSSTTQVGIEFPQMGLSTDNSDCLALDLLAGFGSFLGCGMHARHSTTSNKYSWPLPGRPAQPRQKSKIYTKCYGAALLKESPPPPRSTILPCYRRPTYVHTSHPGADLLPCLPSTVPLQQLNLSTSRYVTLNLANANLHRGFIISG